MHRREDTPVCVSLPDSSGDDPVAVPSQNVWPTATTLACARLVGFDEVCATACWACENGRTADDSRRVVCLEKLGFGIHELRRLCLNRANLAALEDVFQLCDEATRHWLQQQKRVTSCQLETNLVCFTDGSFTPSRNGSPALLG